MTAPCTCRLCRLDAALGLDGDFDEATLADVIDDLSTVLGTYLSLVGTRAAALALGSLVKTRRDIIEARAAGADSPAPHRHAAGHA